MDKELEAMLLLMQQIKVDHTKVPNIKKLTGSKSLYRVRIGTYRIIFSITKTGTDIIRITKRNDNSYNNL